MTDPIGYGLWWRPDRKMMWLIIQVLSTQNSERNLHDWLDRMWPVIKSREDNDVIDCIGLLYVKNETELLWPIQQGTFYDED